MLVFAEIISTKTDIYLLSLPYNFKLHIWERSDSVVECLTGDRGAGGSSLAPLFVSLSKNIKPSLVLVQPRKTPERLLMGCKESNQTKSNCML